MEGLGRVTLDSPVPGTLRRAAEHFSQTYRPLAAAVADCSMATRLACLPFHVQDGEMAYRARQCWYALSSACHAHPYELAPTVTELRGMLNEVEAFIRLSDRLAASET